MAKRQREMITRVSAFIACELLQFSRTVIQADEIYLAIREDFSEQAAEIDGIDRLPDYHFSSWRCSTFPSRDGEKIVRCGIKITSIVSGIETCAQNHHPLCLPPDSPGGEEF